MHAQPGRRGARRATQPKETPREVYHFLPPSLSFDAISKSLKTSNNNLGVVKPKSKTMMSLKAKTARNAKRTLGACYSAWSTVNKAVQPSHVDRPDADEALLMSQRRTLQLHSTGRRGKTTARLHQQHQQRQTQSARGSSSTSSSSVPARIRTANEILVGDLIAKGRRQFNYHSDWDFAPPTDNGRLWSWNQSQEDDLDYDHPFPDEAQDPLLTSTRAHRNYYRDENDPNFVWKELAGGSLDPRERAERALSSTRDLRFNIQPAIHANNPRTHARTSASVALPPPPASRRQQMYTQPKQSTTTTAAAAASSRPLSSSSLSARRSSISRAKRRAQWRASREFVLGNHLATTTSAYEMGKTHNMNAAARKYDSNRRQQQRNRVRGKNRRRNSASSTTSAPKKKEQHNDPDEPVDHNLYKYAPGQEGYEESSSSSSSDGDEDSSSTHTNKQNMNEIVNVSVSIPTEATTVEETNPFAQQVVASVVSQPRAMQTSNRPSTGSDVLERRRLMRERNERSYQLRVYKQATQPRYNDPWMSNNSFPIRDQQISRLQTPHAAYGGVLGPQHQQQQQDHPVVKVATLDHDTILQLSKHEFSESRVNHKAFAPGGPLKVPSFAL